MSRVYGVAATFACLASCGAPADESRRIDAAVEPDARLDIDGGIASYCHPGVNAGCELGERCAAIRAADGEFLAATCTSEGEVSLGGMCAIDADGVDNCVGGTLCLLGRCQPGCIFGVWPPGWTGCPDAGVCDKYVCLPACDAAGEACGEDGGEQGACYGGPCVNGEEPLSALGCNTPGLAASGEPCRWDAWRCEAGSGCYVTTDEEGWGTCATYCSMTAPDCDVGLECQQYLHLPPEWGMCVPPTS